MVITEIRKSVYHSQYLIPAYYPRAQKRRYFRRFRLTPKEQGYKRGWSGRSKVERFNPWVYNAKPYVWKPAHKR